MTYVLRYAYEYKGFSAGYVPVERVLYLYKSVSRHGRSQYLNWKVTEDITQARTWATREGAEKYLHDKFEFDIAQDKSVKSSFVVVDAESMFCCQDMGLMTDCGNDATQIREGSPLCDRHAATWDALVKADKEMYNDSV